MRSIVYSPRQVGNPVLKAIDVPLQLGDISMKPDFLVADHVGVLFLSMRYNSLHPEYIFKRIETIGKTYELSVLLVHADVENPVDALSALTKICIRRDLALVVVWSPEEAGVYLSSLKRKSRANKTTQLKIQKKIGDTYDEQLVGVLTKVPRVNKPDALGLTKKFGSLAQIIENADEVGSLQGWGNTKTTQFKRAVKEPFVRENPTNK